MARRVSWTNNSSGHSGTYVYRGESLDPQNLPVPVFTVAPVAQGETAEWIDNETLAPGDYDYAVQDFDGSDVSALSSAATYTLSEDFSTAQIGDEIGGGIYAGTHTNGTETWHLIFAKQSAESAVGPKWGDDTVFTGAQSADDGLANQTDVLINHDNGTFAAFYHCRDYVDGAGNNDYYLPARNELALVDPLVGMSHPEFSTDLATLRWTSTETSTSYAYMRRFSDGYEANLSKSRTFHSVRPVRRVPA